MQTIEPDAERHFDRAAHGRCHVIHIDRQAHDEGVAQAACSRFWIALAACQFHGRSSSIRLIGWLPIRSITSVNQASGSTPFRRHVSARERSEEHTSDLQSLMRISYAVVCLKKKTK